MNDRNLVLAISSKERREVLRIHYKRYNKECSQGFENWQNRKAIVRLEQFQWMLLANQISVEEFSIGVKKLNRKDIRILYEFIQSESWYILHREILKGIGDYSEDIDEDGFRFFGRPYLNWLQKNIDLIFQNVSVKITEDSKEAFLEVVFKEIVEIVKRTIVYDHIEEYKPKDEVKNWFLSYVWKRFTDEDGYNWFFNDYPVLARLLATRMQYAMINFREFIDALETSKGNLKRIFGIEGDLTLQNIIFNKGDSHNKGKAVILFVINGKKLVYKYKNMEIGNKLNNFFSVMEDLDPSISFYKVTRMTARNYTIEEYIEHKPCLSIQEISEFYRHFGELICISYVLCGNDFHLENLVALKEYPVLIDIETFIQNETALTNTGNAAQQYAWEMNDSILGSHLLPNVFAGKQGEKSVEISALSGDKQILPFKVLQLVDDDDGRMHMEYQQYMMEGAENLPVLENRKVNFKEYSHEIWQGFSETYRVICNNKEYIRAVIETLFSGVQVRNVLKSTQKYMDILEYAYHPTYMTNFINREKLFENLWAYPHKNPVIVKCEVEDLLVNDIPVFYNQTNEKDVITSQGKSFPYYYITALENVQRRLMRFSEQDLQIQKNRLYMALGMFHGEKNPIYFSSDETDVEPLKRAKQITDYICEHIIYGSGKQDIMLPAYSIDEEKNWKRTVMTYSFYDGLSGIYILLRRLTKYYHETKYFDLMFVMDKMFFETIDTIKSTDQYINYMSLLYVISHRLELVYNIKDVAIGEKLLREIMKFYSNHNLTDEWLFGRASLIKVCLKFYQNSGLKTSLEFAKSLAGDIKVQEMDHIGFAHGYTGIIYSLTCLLEFLKQDQLKEITVKIKCLVNKVEKMHYLDDDMLNNSWCNGLVGIGYAQMKLHSLKNEIGLLELGLKDRIIKKIIDANCKDDCLCHGNYGNICFLQDSLKEEDMNEAPILEKKKKLFCKEFYLIRGVEKEPDFGLMTGLAGIAYEYLRYADPTFPNVLLLD